MKLLKFVLAITLVVTLMAGTMASAAESTQVYRDQTSFNKMLGKFGRGVVNIGTCWVEVPFNIATEWKRTDPASGMVTGFIKGVGWGFARFSTGVFDMFTFPFPVPNDYQPLMEPEFIVTDLWGEPIPDITEFSANDPQYPSRAPVYPERFEF